MRVFIGEGWTPPELARHVESLPLEPGRIEVFVAAAEGVIGATATIARHGTVEAEITRPGESELRQVAALRSARGTGAAELAVRAAIERARAWGCKRVVLSTQPGMKAAQRLYERIGFARVPERDFAPEGRGPRLAYALALK